MGFEFSDYIFKVDGESDNDEFAHILDDQDSSSMNDGESAILYGSSIIADGHSYSEQWPRSYKETTDSLSIAASPNGINLLRQAQSITQSITQSLTNITLSHHDIYAKAPFLTPTDKSKEQFDKFASTLTWSTFGKSSFYHASEQQMTTYGCNVTQTVFNGFSVFVGIGLLSVPSTIQEGGWASVGLLLLYAAMCYFTGYLLRKCMEINKDIITFPDLGEAAFGNLGRVFVSIIFYIELYFSCVEFIMMEADNLAKLFPNASLQWGNIYLSPVHFLGILSALIVLPTCYLRDFRKISFISAGGVFGVACIALSLILVGTTDDIGFHQTGPLVKWNGLPYALGVFGFSYSGHSVLPNLYHSMSDKKKFQKALTIIFALSISTYVLVAVSGFLMFGADTNAQITLNLPGNSAATKIALWTTVLSPFFKYPF
ncbi:hypothetical protein BVRB_7g168790 [Beta vulgaris subsp. vulgaris]|nr:hypothetical protein BVRB_7g168790 [Beta vulgaris subsp. vulgaris]